MWEEVGWGGSSRLLSSCSKIEMSFRDGRSFFSSCVCVTWEIDVGGGNTRKRKINWRKRKKNVVSFLGAIET